MTCRSRFTTFPESITSTAISGSWRMKTNSRRASSDASVRGTSTRAHCWEKLQRARETSRRERLQLHLAQREARAISCFSAGVVAHLHQAIHEDAQPGVGRHPPRRRVRLGQQALLLEQLGHHVAHRGGALLDAMAVDEGPGGHRVAGDDVLPDDGGQDLLGARAERVTSALPAGFCQPIRRSASSSASHSPRRVGATRSGSSLSHPRASSRCSVAPKCSSGSAPKRCR